MIAHRRFTSGALLALTIFLGLTLVTGVSAQEREKVPPAPPAKAIKAAPPAELAPAAHAYQEAYNLILDENWEAAGHSLEDFLKVFSESEWTGAARFWQCYARAHTGEDLESVFHCYQAFIDEYPHSMWKDDAEKNMLETARELVNSGHTEYSAFLKSSQASDDTEVALSAILALQETGSDLALPALIELLHSVHDESNKEQMVFLLSRFESREAKAQLVSLAKTDPGDNVREKALFWLSQSDEVTPQDIQAMIDVVNSDSSARVREQAVFALSQLDDRQGAEALIKLGRSHPDPNVRQKALFWLAQSDEVTPGDIKAIEDIVQNDKDPKVREQGVFVLSQLEDRQGASALIALARTHPDANVRQKAMFWISQSYEITPEDIRAIVGVINADQDPKVREQGVFALSQIEDRGGVAALIELARKHPDANVREKSLFWLSQTDEIEPGDIKAIEQAVYNDSDEGVRRSALMALSQIDDDAALDALLKVAREHPDKEFRKKAVQFLAYSDNPRAQEALIELSRPNRN